MRSINQSNSNIIIIDNVEWTNPVLSLNTATFPDSEYWERSDINPEIGQNRLISISGYDSQDNDLNLLVNQQYYFLFQPGLSSINGYDEEYAQEIENFFVVKATIKKQIKKQSYPSYKIWCSLEINEVVNLKDFNLLVKPQITNPEQFTLKEYLEYNLRFRYFRYQNWVTVYFTQQSWWINFILKDAENELTLAYFYEDYCSTEQALITNYILNNKEYRLINQALDRS